MNYLSKGKKSRKRSNKIELIKTIAKIKLYLSNFRGAYFPVEVFQRRRFKSNHNSITTILKLRPKRRNKNYCVKPRAHCVVGTRRYEKCDFNKNNYMHIVCTDDGPIGN